MNALVKTLETTAFAECELSMCAPFLAFDPVMQFIVGIIVVPIACAKFNVGCSEIKVLGVQLTVWCLAVNN